jgi:hypothetical protein
MIKTVEEFIRLRTSEDRDEYLRAAQEEAPIEVWEKLIKEHEDMKQWVALNKKVPLSILEILSNDPDPQVRSCVALKRKLNRKLFEKLARDSDESVRMRIARNPKTPEDIIKILSNDKWIEIRTVAENRLLNMNK